MRECRVSVGLARRRASEATHLERNELDERRERVGRDEPHLVVRVAHAAEDGYDEEDDVGQDLDVEELDEVRDELDGASAVVDVERVAEHRDDALDDVTQTLDRADVAQRRERLGDGVADDGELATGRNRERREERGEALVERGRELGGGDGQDRERVDEILALLVVVAEDGVGLLDVACVREVRVSSRTPSRIGKRTSGTHLTQRPRRAHRPCSSTAWARARAKPGRSARPARTGRAARRGRRAWPL